MPLDSSKVAAYHSTSNTRSALLKAGETYFQDKFSQAIYAENLREARKWADIWDIHQVGISGVESSEIICAAARNGLGWLVWLVDELHISPDHADKEGLALLHHARDLESAIYLIARGASLNPYGIHAASWALKHSDREVAEYLLQRSFASAVAAGDPEMV
jgi:DNA-binding transcriptional LysR family regulator